MSEADKIQALIHINQEIIDRIHNMQDKNIATQYAYYITQVQTEDGVPKFEVKQEPQLNFVHGPCSGLKWAKKKCRFW